MKRCLLIVVWVLGGCAHYSLAGSGPPLNVNTVMSPPHLDIDEAALTRELVGQLQARGYNASWSSGASDVRCQVAQVLTEADTATLVRATWSCEIVHGESAMVVDTVGVVFSNADASTISGAAYAAAAQGIPDIAAKIDATLEDKR